MSLSLIVRRTIRASPERLFAAWTEPDRLQAWWGPAGVSCIGAEIDLSVGGSYRIGNRLADGSELWIAGEFELVRPPHELVYTWKIAEHPEERVHVRFVPREEGTEVIVTHTRITDRTVQRGHEEGWEGCLDGLARYLAAYAPLADV
jgi:uncharacterized protein YndB with AHSA1/START domain